MSDTRLICQLFGISNCDTVRKSRRWFDEHAIAYVFQDFKKQPAQESDLKAWVAYFGYEQVLNRKGSTWRQLDSVTQSEVVDPQRAIHLMLQYNSLIKRPVVSVKNKQGASHYTLGYQPEQWQTQCL